MIFSRILSVWVTAFSYLTQAVITSRLWQAFKQILFLKILLLFSVLLFVGFCLSLSGIGAYQTDREGKGVFLRISAAGVELGMLRAHVHLSFQETEREREREKQQA